MNLTLQNDVIYSHWISDWKCCALFCFDNQNVIFNANACDFYHFDISDYDIVFCSGETEHSNCFFSSVHQPKFAFLFSAFILMLEKHAQCPIFNGDFSHGFHNLIKTHSLWLKTFNQHQLWSTFAFFRYRSIIWLLNGISINVDINVSFPIECVTHFSMPWTHKMCRRTGINFTIPEYGNECVSPPNGK